MAGDALSDLLRTVRLTGATFFDIEGHEPWAVCSPAPSSIRPKILPGADHLISYHVVTAGRCFARIVGQEAIALEAGEVVVFTRSDPHIKQSGVARRSADSRRSRHRNSRPDAGLHQLRRRRRGLGQAGLRLSRL
ncbi:cupin domain-containing protein [Mesorhizobium sp. M0478]